MHKSTSYEYCNALSKKLARLRQIEERRSSKVWTRAIKSIKHTWDSAIAL
ncbi:hypothetical protein PPTG_24072 [Phytophthora nicotianae INRA-310]|uniref:Uncharacterized protein n=1 Tax=Phytophthora nicotianae (strain INRA-310) TaxID=761204 RepID=W2PN67_PHYN3|nr:hypothetical protein PPTG_24072 [Phytophthora nicotianae INRA-310]ETN01475.1 hypothetical protein PPTG_24072 [Phytophthora nicotianae INRA-310]